ncbi:hypothetical protein [Actinomadura verrucosospora]|uniref:Uncharacterized protein n=1 Tax=Actinomadura verrucosospora TaxID=46165 RepID=A0A7D4A7X6_ACTVE|nr:hypothetical protein [Actinomadura verrucosospora]QKG27304.1 hypothetical protein ACTIVE_8959 [Actinomadura verrucosospora]
MNADPTTPAPVNTGPAPAGTRSPHTAEPFTPAPRAFTTDTGAFTPGPSVMNGPVDADQIRSAERALTLGTWLIVFGAMLFSVLTVTPLMRAHTPHRWDWTAPILPLVVDAAVVIVVRLDSVLARLGHDGGRWPAVLRTMTGAMTLSLNIADSALKKDMVGVAVHAVAPLLLIVTAETGLAYRRAISDALAAEQARQHAARIAREQAAAERAEAERQRVREEREHQARLVREQREHEAALAREERQRAEAAERERQAERERAAQERERAERREREREHARRDAEHKRAERAERERRALLKTPPAAEKRPEPEARQIVAAAFAAGLSVRAAAERCGWSIGWVAGRYQELRDAPTDRQDPVPAA